MLRITPINLVLAKPMTSSDNVMSLSAQDAAVLNSTMSAGDHIYFTLVDQRGFETIKYTHTSPLSVVAGVAPAMIDRAQHNTVRKSWPMAQCLLVLNTEGVLREFICANIGSCA